MRVGWLILIMSNFVCALCLNRKFPSVHAYLLHVRIRHSNDANFIVICGIRNCQRQYDKYGSLYKHITREHSDVLFSATSNDSQMDECIDNANSIDQMEDDMDIDVEPELSVSAMQEMYSRELQQSVLKYSLKLREKYILPAATHTDILADCKSLINSVLTCHGNVVRTHLNSTGYNVSEDKTLVDSVLNTNMYNRLWSDCDSSYKLQQNCQKMLGMIKPVEHIAGKFKSYYVPLTDVLKMLVQKEDIAPYVLKETFVHDGDHLTSFTSGSVMCL